MFASFIKGAAIGLGILTVLVLIIKFFMWLIT